MTDKLSSSSDLDLLDEKRRLDEDTGGVGHVGQEEEDIRSNLKSSSSNFDDDEDVDIDDFGYDDDDDDLNGEYYLTPLLFSPLPSLLPHPLFTPRKKNMCQ